MYKTIQARTNYRVDRIGPNGPLDLATKCDGTVQLLLKNGNYHKAPFGGFLDADNIILLRRVKVMFLTALCIYDKALDIKKRIPSHNYVVGTLIEGKVYLLLYDGEVKHHRIKSADDDRKNNVVSLV